ncbi:MAG: tRNA(Ile2) 2-agmatinylcytidine synthetase [Methanoculleus marisnigri]|uniref:tRNA(Ile2) 2-agmatinylcytidine synthetase n=1 Tax=Methanoculleus marisnigri TaxID=2198 RepID=A0A117LP23_9EURY|nr:MAG: tRNA(Ile2) 2-agmatinylcytidine synthetase [Methanoculleus marisnigri]
MTLYLGIDDTDTRESRGTGRLARTIAAELARSYTVTGVTRHQLFVHPASPPTRTSAPTSASSGSLRRRLS